MAGPTVTLTFAGDEKKLTEAMERVGKSSQTMSASVGKASESMRSSGRSIEELRDKAGDTEQRFIGFKDSITGTGDVLKGFREGDVITTAQGLADIAGGLENFTIPALHRLWTAITTSTVATTLLTAAKTAWGAVTTVVTLAMEGLNAVIKANPILFMVGLITVLVTAFLALWTRSEGFRNFFIGMWNGIRDAVKAVVDFIVSIWNGVPGFFATLPDKIGHALGSMGDVIGRVFKGALNVAIEALNWGIDRINDLIYGVNLINPFDDIPSIPHIKKLHQGGKVGGAPGTDQLRILQAGETVLAANDTVGSIGGRVEVVFTGNADTAVATLFQNLVRTGQISFRAA